MRALFCGCAVAMATLGAGQRADADPSFGFGVTFIFGGDVAVGARMFSTDEPESAALALGLDYKFQARSFRPNIGVAYLDEDFYIDLSLGYDTNTAELDYGIGIGAAFEVDDKKSSSSTTPAPAPDPSTDGPT